MSIPFFNYPAVFSSDEEELLRVIRDVGRRGAFIMQRDLEQFERNLAKFVGVEFAVGVANGTDALIMALRAAGIGSGDEVVLPSHTFVATAAAVYFVGATPILVECGEDHLVDPASIETALSERTRAILPVHLNGRTCAMTAIQRIAERHDLAIVEDAAQALGSTFKGCSAGTFGAAGTFSFYPAKALGCLGDGGAVVTNDERMATAVRRLRDHGRDESGQVVAWGLNSRLDNVQAAILNIKLKRFPQAVEYRRKLAGIYDARLRDLAQLRLPPAPSDDPDHLDVYQNYEIRAERRDELQAHLHRDGIGTSIQWGGSPVHQLQGLGFNVRLPYTEKLFERCLLLPMNTSLTEQEVTTICKSIRAFYGRSSNA